MTDVSDTAMPTGRSHLTAAGDRRSTALARLAIGLIQGLALWWLFRAQEGGRSWPATEPLLFWPLVLVSAYLPIVLLAGVGKLRLWVLAAWGIVATAILAVLAWHDIARQAVQQGQRDIGFGLLLFTAAALFIAHHLIVPADRERRPVAAFATYFDTAWLAGVQLVLSIGFAGVFWLLLLLGAALFSVVGLNFLRDLIVEPFVFIPLTTLTFAVAVQLTDVREGLIRGVRTVALMLLSWLLPVLAILVAGFLSALPFAGLDRLWETGSATALVLSAAAALIVLINTAYQDGRLDTLPPPVLRVAVRVAAVLLTPLIGIAIWGLALRIGQHGLTPDRIIAVACAAVGAAYAIGYGYAALVPFVRRSAWMKALEPTNIAAAVLEIALILALFSPLADPARLSVADQVARLQSGAVTVKAFDFAFLRWESGRAGREALDRLTRSPDADIAGAANAAASESDRYPVRLRPEPDRPFQVQNWPTERPLPADFLTGVPMADPRHNCGADACLATQIDLDRDGILDIILATPFQLMLFARENGGWRHVGDYSSVRCDGAAFTDQRNLIRQGRLRPSPPRWPELDTGGTAPSRLNPDLRCPST